VTIELPDKPLSGLHLTSDEARRELAIGLYAGGRVSLGQAASIAGQSRIELQQELGRRHICMNYSLEAAQQDIARVRSKLGQ